MALRVDGGYSFKPQEPSYKKTEIKQTVLTNNNSSNNSVLARRLEGNFQANLRRFSLTANVSANLKPTLSATDAKIKADEIIKNNGGKDNLDTDNAGRELAEIAKTNPADALLVANEIYKKDTIKEEDRDEIAQSFAQNLTDSELQNLASSNEGRSLLRNIESNLLQYPVHQDEAADANRIRTALSSEGVFLGAKEGMYSEGIDPLSVTDDPNASPEEVAAYIKLHPSSSWDPSTQRYAFIDALSAHKDDAQWLSQFYSALGSDLSGQLISETVSPSSHQMPGGGGADPTFAVRQAELIRNSLETMQKGGVLNQEGMNQLLASMPKNEYVATEIFAKSNNGELKKMFINAAVENGDTLWNAGAMQVLNTLPDYQQEQILNGMGDKLNQFIERAMSGEKQIVPFETYIKVGIYANSDMMSDLVKKTTFGGVETLLETANDSTVYYHARTVVPDFSPELQNKLFAAVSIGLNNKTAFENFKDNPKFKDELSQIFIRNGEEILKTQAPDGAFQDINFITGMTEFFELALFSTNGGKLRDNLMESVVKTMGDVGDATKNPPLSQSEYEDLHDGWSQNDHVEVMGGLMAMVWKAAENQKSYIQDEIMQDAAKKKEMVGFFVGMAFSFVPGAGGVIGKVAGEGASFLQQIPDKVIEFTWDQGKDQLKNGTQDFWLNLLKGSSNEDAITSIDVLMDKFEQIVVATSAALPNGETGELSLRNIFQGSFSFYNLVQFP